MGERHDRGMAYGSVGGFYYEQGQYEKALEFYSKYLAIAIEVGNRHCQGSAYGNIGSVFIRLGHFEEALVFHSKALAIAVEVGDRHEQDRITVKIRLNPQWTAS